MDAMAEIRQTFFEECAEQLAELETGLGKIERGEADRETFGVVYRAVHSIRGGAASFDFHDLSAYAKAFERLLGEARDGRAAATPDVLDLMRRAAGALKTMVELARIKDGIVADLRAAAGLDEPAETGGSQAAAPSEEDFGGVEFAPVAVDLADMFAPIGPARYRIAFTPTRDLYARPMRARA